MEKSLFYIKNMDCPSEEQIIRMKLDGINNIKKLDFDLNLRNLTVYHDGNLDIIKSTLDSLNFGSEIISTTNYEGKFLNEKDIIDKKLLWTVLIINFSVFVIEIIFGLIANSMGLIADAIDELSDAFVYGLSIYAISGTLLIKKRIARVSGIFQLLLAAWGFAEVIRRFFGEGIIPDFILMIVFSCIALIGNTASLIVLNKSRSNEIHIKSSQIFTSNDIIANIGVIIAAVLVSVLQTKIPDLLIGLIVFLFVLKGAITIIKLSK